MSDISSKSGCNNGIRGTLHPGPLSSANHSSWHHTRCCSDGNFNYEFNRLLLGKCSLFWHLCSKKCKFAWLVYRDYGRGFRRSEIHGAFLSVVWGKHSTVLWTRRSKRLFSDKVEFMAQLPALPNRKFSRHVVGGWCLDSVCHLRAYFVNMQEVFSNTSHHPWMYLLLDTRRHKFVSCIHCRFHRFPNDLG